MQTPSVVPASARQPCEETGLQKDWIWVKAKDLQIGVEHQSCEMIRCVTLQAACKCQASKALASQSFLGRELHQDDLRSFPQLSHPA
jgi:hypothetical protein